MIVDPVANLAYAPLMKKLGWTDVAFGDVGAREYGVINSAVAGIEALQTADVSLAEQVHKLFQLDIAQADEIDRLRLTVRVLTEVLVDTLGLDETVLQYRLEAAIDEAGEAKRKAQEQGAMVRCESCSATVPASKTNITAFGVVCDACFARQS